MEALYNELYKNPMFRNKNLKPCVEVYCNTLT